ncbi:MAG: phosphoenolpyruvate carboxylase [Cellvibrionaceae bacterium]
MARGGLKDLRRVLKACGFYLATMDIRQESTMHSPTVYEVLRYIEDEDFAVDYLILSEQERCTFLSEQIINPAILHFDHKKLPYKVLKLSKYLR